MPDDSLYFGVGVDPASEMHAVIETMQSHGFQVDQRFEAPHFLAANLHAEGATSLRIVSARGVVLALDSESSSVSLTLDARTGTDVDGDALADIIVTRTEGARSCLALAHVDADGYFIAVPTDTAQLDGATCIEALRDVNQDGQIDALVPMRASQLGFDATITVALMRTEHGPFALHLDDASSFFADERARREALVMGAVDVANQEALVRLACELAWIERVTLTEQDSTRIAHAFDTTVGHLPLSPALSARAQDARARLLQLDVSLGATASVND